MADQISERDELALRTLAMLDRTTLAEQRRRALSAYARQAREDPDVAEPVRVQLSRAKGWRMPEGAVKVDRSTCWGNPFEIGTRVIAPGAYGSLASPYHGCRVAGTHGTGLRAYVIRRVRDRADAVLLFASYVGHDPSGWPPEEIRCALRGLSLACWCPLDGGPCHADVLLAIAAGRSPAEVEKTVREQLSEVTRG